MMLSIRTTFSEFRVNMHEYSRVQASRSPGQGQPQIATSFPLPKIECIRSLIKPIYEQQIIYVNRGSSTKIGRTEQSRVASYLDSTPDAQTQYSTSTPDSLNNCECDVQQNVKFLNRASRWLIQLRL